jgi:EF-P beta-lysylation protein EpmB
MSSLTPLVPSLAKRARQPASAWQQALRYAVRDLGELAELLELPREMLIEGAGASADFPLLVPRGFVARMRKGDPADPLLLQVLPRPEERAAAPGYDDDPLEEAALARAGLLQKYPGRALIVTTGACPVHCRYCFRRAFPYAELGAGSRDYEGIAASLAAAPGVSEVILSGGDPLTLSNARLARLISGIEEIGQLRTLRLHTRFPVIIPERIDAGLIRLLSRSRLQIVAVMHTNHANELDEDVAAALARLKPVTRILLNQSVLLRGINDSVASLTALSERLVACGVAPYYLHLLDRVSGAAHFAVDDSEAVALVEAMRRRAPGYLVPRLVREMPGELSKTPIS